jgi:alkylation response protein AidB-like acyl-CoA dehydrogenase
MDLSVVELDSDQRAFAAKVRDFFAEHITPEVLEHERVTGDGFNEQVHLALGQQGWIMPDWPAADGGAGLDPVRLRILQLEMSRTRMPSVTLSTTRLVVAAVARYADPSIRPGLLAGVAAGTVRFCLGYTEPDGGSDIAAAKVRAVRDGDEWVINGSKIFTTGAHNCQYVFLITRTDPDLPKHKGLTMFLAPVAVPGVEIQAIRTYGGERTNVVYFGDVRVSDTYRLGGVNDGWSVLRGPLDAEHGVHGDDVARKLTDVGQGGSYALELARALEVAAEWAATPGPDGTRPADDPYVRYRLGQVAIDLEAARVTPGLAGRVKCSEALISGAAALIDLLGPVGVLAEGDPGAPGGGQVDFAHRFAQGTATYGGTVEVYRAMIAQHVLGLPRPSYPGAKVLVQKKRYLR